MFPGASAQSPVQLKDVVGFCIAISSLPDKGDRWISQAGGIDVRLCYADWCGALTDDVDVSELAERRQQDFRSNGFVLDPSEPDRCAVGALEVVEERALRRRPGCHSGDGYDGEQQRRSKRIGGRCFRHSKR